MHPNTRSNRTPFFSVITVCLNAKETIPKTVASVLSQDRTLFEYLVIDGGSTDGTAEILKGLGDELDYFVSERDSGIYSAMNKAIRQARGVYCIFLNADDYFVEGCLKRVHSMSPTEDILYGDVLVLTKKGLVPTNYPTTLGARALHKVMLCHQGQFIRRDLFTRAGEYDEALKISADYEFVLRAVVGFGATTRHIGGPISVYNDTVASHTAASAILCLQEKRVAQLRHFGQLWLATLDELDETNLLLPMRLYNRFPWMRRVDRWLVGTLKAFRPVRRSR